MNKIDKAINWVRKYWYLVLVAVSGLAIVIAGIFFRGRSKALVDAFMKNREGMLKQVKKIEQLNEAGSKKKDQAIKQHTQERDELDESHKEKLKQIEDDKKQVADDLANGEIEDLADAIKDGFNL